VTVMEVPETGLPGTLYHVPFGILDCTEYDCAPYTTSQLNVADVWVIFEVTGHVGV
jgi:hypothetical protein